MPCEQTGQNLRTRLPATSCLFTHKGSQCQPLLILGKQVTRPCLRRKISYRGGVGVPTVVSSGSFLDLVAPATSTFPALATDHNQNRPQSRQNGLMDMLINVDLAKEVDCGRTGARHPDWNSQNLPYLSTWSWVLLLRASCVCARSRMAVGVSFDANFFVCSYFMSICNPLGYDRPAALI